MPGSSPAQETDPAGFSVLASGWCDGCLPQALKDLAGFPEPGAEYLAVERAVRISWAARENGALDAYRVTATIRGGPWAGVTAQWIVRPRSRAAGGPFGYELRLPMVAGPSSRVVATLEALGKGGEQLAMLSASRTLSREQGPSLRGGPALRSGVSGPRPAATTARAPSLGASSTFVVRAWPEATGRAFPLSAGSLVGATDGVLSRGPPA